MPLALSLSCSAWFCSLLMQIRGWGVGYFLIRMYIIYIYMRLQVPIWDPLSMSGFSVLDDSSDTAPTDCHAIIIYVVSI